MKDPDKKEINHTREQKEEVSNAHLSTKLTSLDAIGEYVKPPNTTRGFRMSNEEDPVLII